MYLLVVLTVNWTIIFNFEWQLSNQMITSIKLHGILLWASMGFLMPMGILFIRMANKANENGRNVKVFFYLHVIFQVI